MVAYVRLAQGTLRAGESIRLMASGAESEILELGIFRPQLVPVDVLGPGEVGYVATGLKSVRDCQVGDTLTSAAATGPRCRCPATSRPRRSSSPASTPSTGPTTRSCATPSRSCTSTTPPSASSPRSSVALGFGFRCGFLGLLHMEIIQERLEREFDLDIIASAPSVEYLVTLTHDRGEVRVENPALLPGPSDIEAIAEPWVKVSIVTPTSYIGTLLELGTNRRGAFLTWSTSTPRACS